MRASITNRSCRGLPWLLALAFWGMVGPTAAHAGGYGHDRGYGVGYSRSQAVPNSYSAYHHRQPGHRADPSSYGHAYYDTRRPYRGPSGYCANRAIGGALGGAFGGLLGSKIGKGTGQLAATAAGALLGYTFGQHVAAEAYRCN